MESNCISKEQLPVLDNKFFTKEQFIEWYNLLLEFSTQSINVLNEEVGEIEGIDFDINTVLLHEVVYDAIVGLKTITKNDNYNVQKPNPFKIASYLGYWFLRHKPIIFMAKHNLNVDELTFNESIEKNRLNIITDIKHINEVTAARFMLRYIFELDCKKPVCKSCDFKRVKKTKYMFFDSFSDMFNAIYEKLLYYLCYRAISPKTLEHFLEAYTLHPYMPYTCDLWNTKNTKE